MGLLAILPFLAIVAIAIKLESPSFAVVIVDGDIEAFDLKILCRKIKHYPVVILLILGENVDPEPDIAWYVDTERVAENQDRIQYTHIPSATTQITYYVYAYVTPYQGTTVTLRSDPITVYRAFNGFTLTYDNLSSVYTPYRYGDTVTFDLSAGDSSATITEYSWELSEVANLSV